ncbi:MAG TPA: hypothetical protein PLC76_09200 [Saprospiraceae bacterium]|nr:hypothetical protein [Candidatus Parvibacillus calidus]MBX2935666.1 hypothetical protein [Saprospiraceae bacterium]MBX7178699.1 hypothetical protein [Saprospiraceae bacterium]MCB0591735.1 hypothetical protein [Saprospiraceae bacterium]MCO5284625.1 hypothetical protein [Saprospiraceae bacterium]
MFKFSCILSISILLFVSCTQDSPYNKLTVKDVPVKSWVRYEKMLDNVDTLSPEAGLRELELKYPEFTTIYFLRVINDSYNPDTNYAKIFGMYRKSPVLLDLQKNFIPQFNALDKEEKEYSESFERLRQLLPGIKTPDVFTCLTEFGISVFSTSDTVMGISLEMYLGKGNKYYSTEIWPMYIQRSMNRDNIVSNLLKNYIRNSILPQKEPGTLLEHMIQQGKEVYLLRRLIKPEKDTLIYDYSADQLEFCRENEKSMWSFFLSEKLVYNSHLKEIQKYIDPAPTSPGMPPASPGRTTAYIGGQILEAYMKRHPEISVKDMIRNTNAQKILEDAKYKP